MASSSKIKPTMDGKSGFCESTGIYHSKREAVILPSPHQPLDITTYIFSHRQHAEIAVIDAPSDTHLTYSKLRQNVKALAVSLKKLIRKRDVVLVISPNSIHLPYIYLTVLSIGGILTTANPLNTEAEIQNQVRDSKPSIIFTVSQLLGKLSSIRTPFILIDGTEVNNSWASSRGANLSALLQSGGTQLSSEWIDDGVSEREAEISQDDIATLLYSSGTTGKSKGVLLTHMNYIAIIAANRARYEMQGIYLCSIPMYYIYGLRFMVCSLAAGATLVIMPGFNMNEMLHNIEKYRVTLLPTVPSVLSALTKSSEACKYDLSSLKQIGLGGAPVGYNVMQDFSAKFPGIELRQGYGMTESTAAVVYTNSNEENFHYGSVGLLSGVVEAKVVDPVSAKPLPPNHRGELWLRGPTIMKGYFMNEEATLATLDMEGWLKTGDLCYIDEEGFLFVVDRLKDMIKYKAYQVAPAELEELLLTHPDILEAAVIPYPDQEAGQIPMAYVVKNPYRNLNEKDVMNFVAKQVAPYKKIRRVALVNSIPKNSSGKILRRDLIEKSKSLSRL
ncbi:hypothetical protein SUGI_0886870 [Cryptomeria japonica]|uniref:probable CoA ligase CCL5 n=1 Tax=Cryptomeria japonica TaxID=3369 RepID=UPI0024149B54|nr:probable CoA ligase CCL5 [Cryptomeria japonica]GLJ42769.1 hypothetical protein SUGI_0886870 [Cryptomeria japonica]